MIKATGTLDKAASLKPRRKISRERVALYSGALLACQLVILAIGAVEWALHVHHVRPLGYDFRVFWSVSFLSIHDGAMAAFNLHQLSAVEDTLLPNFFGPWVYPPTFQLLIYPLAIVPYPASYAMFVCAGIVSCLIACAPAMKARPLPWITLLAFPGIWIATLYGQNSLFTMALAAGALGCLERRPALAGILAGMLVIKPQLAVLFPLFFLCGRHFRALGAMAVTAILLCSISAFIFGVPLWLKFFQTLSWFDTAILGNNDGGIWSRMPTVFAAVRRLGAGLTAAYAIHATIALSAVLATAILWVRQADFEVRAAATIISALLVPPYLIYYDLAWLLLPIIYLCADGQKRERLTRFEYTVVTLAWFLPLISLLAVLKPLIGQWGPVLLPVLLVVVLFRAHRAGWRQATNQTSHCLHAIVDDTRVNVE
jgi:hypothetical protein